MTEKKECPKMTIAFILSSLDGTATAIMSSLDVTATAIMSSLDGTVRFQTEDLIRLHLRMGFSVIACGNPKNDRKERMPKNDNRIF